MRIFKTKAFTKFARKERIHDTALRQAIIDAESGKIDADYGGGVIKQRVARANEGKSGGYRTIILYRRANRAFFVFGFAKKDQDNISAREVKNLRDLADMYFAYLGHELDQAVKQKQLVEITNGKKIPQ